jgi:hypothetical protein
VKKKRLNFGLLVVLLVLLLVTPARAETVFASVGDYMDRLPPSQADHHCEFSASQQPDVVCPRGVGFHKSGFETSDVFGAVIGASFKGASLEFRVGSLASS